MKYILNQEDKILFRFYSIIESNIDLERVLTNAFYNSTQYKEKLTPVQQFGCVTIDEDFSVYHRITQIPYSYGWVEQKQVPQLKKCRTHKIEYAMVHDQGWEILDDVEFMEWYRTTPLAPGPNAISVVPQVKHSVISNMHTISYRSSNKLYKHPAWESKPVLPSLEHCVAVLKTRQDEVLAEEHKKIEAKKIEELPEQVLYAPDVRSIVHIAPLLRWGTEFTDTCQDTDKQPDLDQIIPGLVTETIANMDFLKYLNCDTTLIASAITSSVLAIGTSLHSLLTNESTTATKVLHSVAIVSSLTTFVLALHKLLSKNNIRTSSSELCAQLPQLASNILGSTNRANSMSWIYPSVAALVSLVIASLTVFNVCDIKSVIEKGRLLNSTKSFSNTATDITKFLLEDIAGLDVTGDQAAFMELNKWAKRTSELSIKTTIDYIQNAELNAELHQAVNTTIPIITNKYANRDISHAARTAYQLILSNISKLQEKIEAIKIINDACKRIETFGVFFGGKKGVGKSALCNYVAEYIANIMGLPKTMYNLNKSKDTGFYGPYGGAAFAEIQEFMALKENDPNLAHINQIISGDHFNLESAHLSGKQQPFNARVVFLTANNLCPDLLRVLEIEAARATWDRILRFEVIDKKVDGRSGMNAHRKPDFSHLEFNFVTSTDEVNSANLVKTKITINEVLGIVLYQTAFREHQFIQRGISSGKMSLEDTEKRVTFLKGIIERNTIVKANAGQDFNILRIEGPQFVGKSRLADQMASYVHGLLPTWPIIKVRQIENKIDPIAEHKGIYIIDDIIETNYASYQAFLQWINIGHADNFYIIVTNHTYPIKWNRNLLMLATTPYWVVDTHGCSSGIARRLGLEGEMSCSDGSRAISSSRSTQIFVSKPGMIKRKNEDMTLVELKELVFSKFQDYLKCKEIITLRHENYTDTNLNFDCEVRLATYAHVAKAFSSLITVTKARLGLISGVSLKFKSSLIPEITRQFRSEEQLLPGIVNCRETLLQQSEALCVILNRAIPGLSARFVIEQTGDDLILKDRVLYVGYNLTNETLRITHSATQRNITFTFIGETRVITYKVYAKFLETGILPEELNELQPEVITRLNLYVKDNIRDSIFKYESFMAGIEIAKQQFVENNLLSFMKKRPIITLITGLVTLTTASALIALIAKAFSKNEAISNSYTDDEDATYDPRVHVFTKRYKKALLNDRKEIEQIRKEVEDAGLTRQFNHWEDEWRSNSASAVCNYLPSAIENADIKKIIELCQLNPEQASVTLRSINSNMLSLRDEKHQTAGPLEQLAERLRKNYVHIHSKLGNLYGLMIKGNRGITVSHCVDDHTKDLEISSDGVIYNAKIEKVSRERDLLTFTVVDKTFPPASDITNLFPTSGDMLDLNKGWYIRPTMKPLIVNAPIQYIDRHVKPLTDNNNPFFRVEGRSWKYRLLGIATCADTFKIGDCGFPLIGRKNNQLYIIGIHNAFSIAHMGWFASVVQEDLQVIVSNFSETRAAKTIKHPLLRENMVVDDKMHSLILTEYDRSVYENMSPLKMFGYNANLLFRSFPKHKKQFCEVASKHLTCNTIGAALDATNVEDFSDLYPDRNGNYYPLFSQAVKYALSQQREESFEARIDKHVSDFLKIYYKKHYPAEKILKPHEVINGLVHLKPLDMTTSAGPKMKKIFNINTKRPLGNEDALFRNESKTEKPWYVINTTEVAGSTLLNDYSHYMSVIKQGQPICCVVKDNAKVELLPIEKVKKGKVRLFNEMDLSINMVLKSYFGPILEKVMEHHDTTFFCIGMNPYKDATAHMLYFDNMDGYFVNADFAALDKTVTAHMIKDFVECMLPHVPAESRDALFKTLTYRLHSMNGNIYFTDSGNASGSFVTTILNCHVVAKTTLYTFARKYEEEFGILPSYAEFVDNIIIRVLGDDAIRKVSNIFSTPPTQDDFIKDAEKYRLKQTPAKVDGEVAFCSREYVKHKKVYFPRLKQSSITSSLFWFKKFEPELIFQNCFVAVMEAGLWDKEFFDKIINAVVELSKVFNFKIDLVSYEVVQECWYDYICDRRTSPVWGRGDPDCINETNSNTSNKFLKMADMWLNEYVQKNKLEQPVYKYSAEGPDENLTWHCQVNLLKISQTGDELIRGEGEGVDKSSAKREACEELKKNINEVNSNVEIEWLCYRHLGKEFHTPACKKNQNIYKSEVAFVRYMRDTYPAMNFLEKDARKMLMETKCTTAIKTSVEGYINNHLLPRMKQAVDEFTGKLLDKEKITKDEMEQLDSLLGAFETLDVKANVGDMPIEPAVMNQAMNAQSAAQLPSMPTPQPTAMAPAVTAPGDDIMSTVQIVQETTLNPMGAPNMLSVGGLGFDLKMLIYEQYMDCDIEFSTTESAPTGAVILQIPYAVISQYINYYIKAYAVLHDRYTGSLKFRITAIGNQLLSGAVGACWREKRTQESTILISEAQKIAHEMKGVNNPFNEIHTLHDARQDKFFRRVEEDILDSLDDRPHLVLFVGMNVYNPYRDNTLVRFRIASKLANGKEPNPFFFGLPVRNDLANSRFGNFNTLTNQVGTVSPARAFNDVFPQTLNSDIFIYTDGTLRQNTEYRKDTKYPGYTPKVYNNAGWKYAFNGTYTKADSSTATASIYTSTELTTKHPDIKDFYTANGVTVVDAVVGIVSQSTMDSTNYAILTASAAFPGLGSYPLNIQNDKTHWDMLKTMNGWRIGSPTITWIPSNDIRIRAILYNDTPIALGSLESNDGRTYHYMRAGQIKVITNFGTSIYYLIATATTSNPSSVTLRRNHGLLAQWNQAVSGNLATVKDLASYPNLNIDSSLGALPNFDSLPLGYQALRITDIPASSLTIDDYPGPTATNETIIDRWFFNMSANLTSTACLEMTLVDSTSQRLIATVRYYPEWRQFLINAETPNYKSLPINTSNITIQSIVEIERTNAFPQTDTSLWFSRTSTISNNVMKELTPNIEFESVESNMAMAIGAGIFGGVGEALGKMGDRKHEEKMQNNMFGHQENMQNNMFAHQTNIQGNQFGHEQAMALMDQHFNKIMQNNQFGQERDMTVLNANEQRATNRLQSQNRMVEKGMGTRTNFLNTSFSTSV